MQNLLSVLSIFSCLSCVRGAPELWHLQEMRLCNLCCKPRQCVNFYMRPKFITKNRHGTRVRHTAGATHQRETLWTMRLGSICCPVLLPPFWFETSLVFWLYLPFVGEQEVDNFLWSFWPWLQHLLHYHFFSFFKPAQGCLLGRRHFSRANRCRAKVRAVAGVCGF